MAEMERIINKLRNYLIDSKGFKKNGEGVTKTLSDEFNKYIRDDVIIDISEGRCFGGDMKYMYGTIEDNCLSSIEDELEDVLNLTEHEQRWLCSYDDGCYGLDLISDWIWENVQVICNKAKADVYVNKVYSKHLQRLV